MTGHSCRVPVHEKQEGRHVSCVGVLCRHRVSPPQSPSVQSDKYLVTSLTSVTKLLGVVTLGLSGYVVGWGSNPPSGTEGGESFETIGGSEGGEFLSLTSPPCFPDNRGG